MKNTNYTLDNKVILVTGGAGSFGQVFVKFLLDKYNTKKIIIYSRDELKHFEMMQKFNELHIEFFIGDIRDQQRFFRALKGVDVIVHAAALKQVPAAEYNPIECIKTNIIGAETVINGAIDAQIERVISLSTDKAANPINLYGATKLCSDKLFIAANHLAGKNGTKFSIVRYGNVIESKGSVIPYFKSLQKKGVLPITDVRMTRFWITLDQGAEFVDRCLCTMKGGELFVRKSPSMRIVDLATAIAPECKHEIVGIRPGEKLHEVMVPHDEAIGAIEFKDMIVIKPAFSHKMDRDYTTYNDLKGTKVDENFEYRSDNNDVWITIGELREIIKLENI